MISTVKYEFFQVEFQVVEPEDGKNLLQIGDHFVMTLSHSDEVIYVCDNLWTITKDDVQKLCK